MINDELERMRDANRGRRESPEQRMASLTGEQPSVAPSPNPRGTGATRSPEERMEGISPQPAPEIPAPAPDPEPPPTDDIAALKLELSNAMTALQGLMMAANDALNKAHEARDLYDDDFPEWPSDGGGIDVLRVLSFSCSVVVDENDQDKQKIKVEKGWFVDAKEYGEFAGELVEVPDLDGHYWLYVLATKAEDPEEDDPQWDIAVESTDEPESEFEEYELTGSNEKVVRVLCHVKRDGDDLEIVWRNHEGDVSRGGGGLPDFPFRVSVFMDGETRKIRVSAGMVSTERTDWEEVATKDFTFIDGGVVFISRVYPTTEDPAMWDEDDGSYLYYDDTVPAQSETRRVVRIASTIDDDGVPQVLQEHFGNIFVIDLIQCEELE